MQLLTICFSLVNVNNINCHKFLYFVVEYLVSLMDLQIVNSMDKLGILWHRLPVFVGLFYLGLRRHLHQEYNLFNVGKTPVGVRFNPGDYPYRTANGEFNDPFNEGAGSEGTFFGRNILPADQKHKVYTPTHTHILFNYILYIFISIFKLKNLDFF